MNHTHAALAAALGTTAVLVPVTDAPAAVPLPACVTSGLLERMRVALQVPPGRRLAAARTSVCTEVPVIALLDLSAPEHDRALFTVA